MEASWTASSALKASAEGSTIISATVEVSNGDTQFAVWFLQRSGKRSIDKMVLRAMVEVLGSQKSINVIRIAIEEPSMPRHRGKGVAGSGANNWPCFRVPGIIIRQEVILPWAETSGHSASLPLRKDEFKFSISLVIKV